MSGVGILPYDPNTSSRRLQGAVMRIFLTTLALAAIGSAASAQVTNLVYLTNEDTGSVFDPGQAGDLGDGSDSGNSRKVAIVDLDGDGNDDVFFLNHNLASAGFLNDGNGVFTADPNGGVLYGSTAGTGAKGVAFADVDGNSTLDAFIATGPIGGVQQQNVFLLNTSVPGTTSFLDITGALSVGFDNDHSYDGAFLDIGGVLHLAVANRLVGGDPAFGRNKLYQFAAGDFVDVAPVDGEFQTANLAQVRNSRDLVVADFDNDGDDDLFVANAGNGLGEFNEVFVQTGGAMVNELVVEFLLQDRGGSYGAAAADLNNDGLPELLVANRATAATGEANQLWVNASPGADDVEFVLNTLTVLDDALDPSYDVAFADLDADGFQDVFVANNSANNRVFLNSGVGLLDPGSFIEIEDGLLQSNRGLTRSAAVAELGDYGPDGNHQAAEVAFANANGGANFFFRGYGQQYVDLGGGTNPAQGLGATLTPVATATGFMSPSTGGSIHISGGLPSGPTSFVMNLTDEAVPFNGGILIAGTPAFASPNFTLTNGEGDFAVDPGDIPASLSGAQVFMQFLTRDPALAGQAGLTNRFSVVIQ